MHSMMNSRSPDRSTLAGPSSFIGNRKRSLQSPRSQVSINEVTGGESVVAPSKERFLDRQ